MFSRFTRQGSSAASYGSGSHQPPPPPSSSAPSPRRGNYSSSQSGPYGIPPPVANYPSRSGQGSYAQHTTAYDGRGGGYGAATGGYGSGVPQQGQRAGYWQQGGGVVGARAGGGGYGGGGISNGGYPPAGIEPEYVQWFRAADQDGNGRVDARELQSVLSHSPYEPFSMRTVTLMMELFDRRRLGTIGIEDFSALMKYLSDWRIVFERFDQDRSGYIDARELGEAFRAFGYSLSQGLLMLLVSKFDKSGRGAGVAFDNFIACCVIIKGLTDGFKEKDINVTGSCTLSYEQFMMMVLPFVAG